MYHFAPNALRLLVCVILATLTAAPVSAAAQQSDPAIASSDMNGVQPGPAPSDPLEEMWRFKDSGYMSLQPPLVTDELAITVGEGDNHRFIVALDKSTGELVWQREMSEETLNSFAVAGDLLFVRADDGYLQALAVNDGQEQWTSPTAIGDFPQEIVTDGEHVYVTNSDRTVAVDTQSGKMDWEARPFPGSRIHLEALTNDILFAASVKEGDGIVALDVATGDELWRYERPGGSIYASAAANEQVVVAQYNDGLRSQGWIALDTNSGSPLWEMPNMGMALFEVATANTLYACANDSIVAIGMLSGSSVWSKIGECSGLTVTDEAVTFASDGKDGHAITSLSLDGAPRWSLEITGNFDEVFGHAIRDGVIYVGTYSQDYQAELIAISGETRESASGVPADSSSAEITPGPADEPVSIPECSDFGGYDEVQGYYAEHPEAQPVLDQDMDGLACEIYFSEEPAADIPEPPVTDVPSVDGSGGDAGDSGEPVYTDDPVAPSVPEPASDDGNAGDTNSGSGPVYTEFGGLDGIDYDCYDFASQGDAQAYFESDGGGSYNNADGLDRNHNGLACEDGEFD